MKLLRKYYKSDYIHLKRDSMAHILLCLLAQRTWLGWKPYEFFLKRQEIALRKQLGNDYSEQVEKGIRQYEPKRGISVWLSKVRAANGE